MADTNDFNCLFCYCPLYHLEDCGGNYSFTDKGVKDCSNCTLPHKADNYDFIITKLKEKYGVALIGYTVSYIPRLSLATSG